MKNRLQKVLPNPAKTLSALLLALAITVAIPQQAALAASDPTVYVAPSSGKKYHRKESCRGLNNANTVKSYKLSKLPKKYTACKICKPQGR